MTEEREPDLAFKIPNTVGLDFWRANPTVDRLLSTVERDREGTSIRMLYVWLLPARDLTPEEIRATPLPGPRPDRSPDLDLFGEGSAEMHFWEALPNLEYSEIFQESMSDKDYPYGWWAARLWFKARDDQ